ncbi:MAG: right-handed parallel beta-helix repeat-containing protein [Methyloprofundus sp.]|nr:right-handed parallel beta-helix repeat-containing protein [Methyloprofundus sp.]
MMNKYTKYIGLSCILLSFSHAAVSAEQCDTNSLPILGSELPSNLNSYAGIEKFVNVYRVGPSHAYKRPSDVAGIAEDNSLIEIEAGEYFEDVAVWRQNNITIRGVGGLAHMDSNGRVAQQKAIWVIKGNNVIVDSIEFSGARVADLNGAGIRIEGANLTIRHAYFHDNEMGVLSATNLESEILIEDSEFSHNSLIVERNGSPPSHNIYIGEVAKFTLRRSYIHDAEEGNNVKSRARENYILHNRITDETSGSSYLLDLSNGGKAYIVGNVFHQSALNYNSTLVSFAAEKKGSLGGSLYVGNNNMINSSHYATFVRNYSGEAATVTNNVFVGKGQILSGSGDVTNSTQFLSSGVVNY